MYFLVSLKMFCKPLASAFQIFICFCYLWINMFHVCILFWEPNLSTDLLPTNVNIYVPQPTCFDDNISSTYILKCGLLSLTKLVDNG